MLSQFRPSSTGLTFFFWYLRTFAEVSAENSGVSLLDPTSRDSATINENVSSLINSIPGDEDTFAQKIALQPTKAVSGLLQESGLPSEESVPPILSLSNSDVSPHQTLPPNRLSSRQNNPQLLTQNTNNAPMVVRPVGNGNLTANSRIGATKNFNETVQIQGGFIRTQLTWTDGLTIDTLSATPHNMVIRRMMQPASAKFVTSADPSRSFLGGDWRELTRFSYAISIEDATSDDLVFKISVPYDRIPPIINPPGIDDDVYLAVFDRSRGGWVIDTDRTDIRRREKRIELIGIPAPSGEYRLLTRSNRDRTPLYFNFGNVTNGQFNVIPFPGGIPAPLQVGTWQDGSKVIIRSVQAMQITVQPQNITTEAIPSGYEAATRYALVITTTTPAATVVMNLQLPYVPTQLQDKMIAGRDLMVLGRPLRTNRSYQFLSETTISGSGALMNTPLSLVEGEYFLAVRSK